MFTSRVGSLVRIVAALGFSLFVAACDGVTNDGDASVDAGPDAPCDPTASLAALAQLTQQLDANRTMALPASVGEMTAAEQFLYYQDTSNLTPRLLRIRGDGTGGVAYAFTIGSGDFANYRASDALVVTAITSGSRVEYRAYDPAQPEQLIASTSLGSPSSGARWYSYAVDGSTAYIVDDSVAGATTLLRWNPAQGSTTTTVLTLESAGATIGSFADFGVSGDTMVFLESGRVWTLNLTTRQAVWLRNMQQASGTVNFDAAGVLFDTNDGISYYSTSSEMISEVSSAIDANDYRLTCDRPSSHHYAHDFAKWGDWMIYGASAGIFAFNLRTQVIRPVLLEEGGPPFITYRYPTVLTSGVLFVVGLTSQSGSTGADGPIYRVDLNVALQ